MGRGLLQFLHVQSQPAALAQVSGSMAAALLYTCTSSLSCHHLLAVCLSTVSIGAIVGGVIGGAVALLFIVLLTGLIFWQLS